MLLDSRLARRPPRPDRPSILGSVSSRTPDTHISRIRSKLPLDHDKNPRIIPIHAVGYRLVPFGAAMTHAERHEAAPIPRAAPRQALAADYA